jgi:hypothetical protein
MPITFTPATPIGNRPRSSSTELFRRALALAALASLFGFPAAAKEQAKSPPDRVFVAELHAMNSNVTGRNAAGRATFTITGDKLAIDIEAQGLPADMMHLAHFHGFTDNRRATCPPPDADKNRDGIVDLIETEPYSGVTMVPFNADPVALHIVSSTYPKASANGTWTYHKTVALKALQAAVEKAYHDAHLDLGRRVVYIHGVPPSTKLPASVQSLDHIPAQVTLPIACGEIKRKEK